jgi:hypothetical protein
VDGLEESIFLVYGSKNIMKEIFGNVVKRIPAKLLGFDFHFSLHLLADGLHQPKRVSFLLIVIFGILLYCTNLQLNFKIL